MEAWELGARESIRETVARYAHAVDSGRFDDLVALFAPDGVLEIQDGETMRGRDAIHDFLTGVGRDLSTKSSARMIRHFTSNLRIDVESPERGTGALYFLALTEIGVDHWGRYRDVYVPEGDRWLFAHRSVRTDGRASGSFFDT